MSRQRARTGWLETDFICDRSGRQFVPNWRQNKRVRVHPSQLDSWYRTLDQHSKAKERIEVALYYRLRDLFSLKPELILYDITSTYFEGAGPENLAKHGYSRDSKPHNVQVVVVVVMVSGWPIAHHVWPGNQIDHDTVQEVVRDLHARSGFSRIIFAGDRGMVTAENLESLKRDQQGFVVGLNRRRNAELKEWLNLIDETKWMNCPVGITTQERTTDPPRTRAQEVSSGDPGMRVIIVDSDERRAYEQAMRERSMDRTRVKLEKLKARVVSGRLKTRDKIIQAAERVLGKNHGQRYYAYKVSPEGVFEFSANRAIEALTTVRHVTFRLEGQAKRTGVAGARPMPGGC